MVGQQLCREKDFVSTVVLGPLFSTETPSFTSAFVPFRGLAVKK